LAERELTLRARVIESTSRLAPGLIVVGLVAVVAFAVDAVQRRAFGLPVIEALVAAILLGSLVRNLTRLPQAVDRGGDFAARQLLEGAVLLLGPTIDARQILAAGPILLIAIALGIVGGIAFSFLFGRAFGLSNKLALLVAVGNSICGNSAIAAVAPVIRAEKKDVVSSIALTAIIGVIVVLTLPFLMPLARLSQYQYGVLAGMTVYAVPQVVAASFPVGLVAGEVAMFVKLVRVLFLGPLVLLISLAMRVRGEAADAGGGRPALVPWFIVGFLCLAALRLLGLVPEALVGPIQYGSRILMVLAMAGLGLGVEFGDLRRAGQRVAATVCLSLAALVALSLGLILALRLAG
jgi:uncharacterized integral membrane protein (TIGR00698 family)